MKADWFIASCERCGSKWFAPFQPMRCPPCGKLHPAAVRGLPDYLISNDEKIDNEQTTSDRISDGPNQGDCMGEPDETGMPIHDDVDAAFQEW